MNVHERQRVVDTDDQNEFAAFDLDIEGEIHRVALDRAEPLRDDRLSPAVSDLLADRHGVVASGRDVWHDDRRSRIWVAQLDEVGDLGTVDVVLSADERSPGRFVVELLGYVAADAPDRWLSVGYLELHPSWDLAEIGALPQMKELHEPPRLSLYGDGTYTRRYVEAFPPDLRLDLFAMERNAIRTDLITTSWLRSSGVFVSPRFAAILREFVVPDVMLVDLEVHHAGERVPLVFVHMFDSTCIDYPASRFLATGRMHNDYREWFSVDNVEELLGKRNELMHIPERPGIELESIALRRRADLLGLRFELHPYVSHRLARRMAAENITGVDLKPPTFLIG